MSINRFGPVALVYPDGAPLVSKQIEVRDDAGALATLYTSISGGLTEPNPTATDAFGMVDFYAEEGVYHIEVTESGFIMTVVVYPPTGNAAEIGEVKTQSAAAATWNFAHGLGRLPTVSVYLVSGEEVDADITASASEVNVVWPSPMAGKLVLT